IEAEIGLLDRLTHRLDQRLVPRLNHQQARFRGGHRAHLVQRHRLTVGLDPHQVEKRRRGLAGPDAGQFASGRFQRLLHALFRFGHDLARHETYSLTIVPTFSPWTTWTRLPRWPTLKTTNGMRLSMHSVTAVASMTLRPRFRISK